MGLGLGFGMRRGHGITLERQSVAGIGIGEDRTNLSDRLLGQSIGADGARNTFVTDMVGDNPTLLAAIDRPNYCPLPFF